MKPLLLLLLAACGLYAQVHKNKPIPQLDMEAAKVIDEGITGWSRSLNGQWVSEEMKIPIRAVSFDKDAYETDANHLGLDNISELVMIPGLYGNDSICVLVKIMTEGYYKYKTTQQKWQTRSLAYYYVFNRPHLDKLKNLQNGISTIKIPLRDFGELPEVKTKHLDEELLKAMVIKPQTDQRLVVSINLDENEPEKIYFQFASQHNVFSEVEGVIRDIEIDGHTIYGTPLLMNYLHYEYDKTGFQNFFKVK